MNVRVTMEMEISKQGWVDLLSSSINIYGHVIIMIHLAHDAADQHQQAHNNRHQVLQNSEACSLLLFLGSDRVQLERVPGVSVRMSNMRGKNQTEELVRGRQQGLNAKSKKCFPNILKKITLSVQQLKMTSLYLVYPLKVLGCVLIL